MSKESYECGYCGVPSEITQDAKEREFAQSAISPTRYCYVFFTEVFYCLNSDCRKISLKITVFRSNSPLPAGWGEYELRDYYLDRSIEPPILKSFHDSSPQNMKGAQLRTRLSTIKTWDLLTGSIAKPFPDYIIPKEILEDYQEACAIKDLSPKAAATLTRRCLQGMIRDFFGIKKRNLKEEIDAIKGKDYVSDAVWKAIQGVREIGNIGAHMKKNTNLIANIDPGEAERLIWLLERLFVKWYIQREYDQEGLEEISSIAKEKKNARTADTENDSRESSPPSPAE